MSDDEGARTEELLQRARRLDGGGRSALLQEVRDSDPSLASQLEEILLDERAESLFATLLSETGRPSTQDVDRLCDENPELAASLRRHFRQWRAMGDLAKAVPGSNPSLPGQVDRGCFKDAGQEADRYASETASRLQRLQEKEVRHRVQSEIARGGQGVVFRGWDEGLQRKLAVKMLRSQCDAVQRGEQPDCGGIELARFFKEAYTTARLDHPGVVPVYEQGVDRGRAFFTMKLVDGDDLAKVFRKVGKAEDGWTTRGVLDVLTKVSDTLRYAHANGVVHRDIKPGNIMVGRFGEVYLMDWGIARILPSGREQGEMPARRSSSPQQHALVNHDRMALPDLTSEKEVFGTLAYMPPEQLAGDLDAIGPHSDVYAMGAMLYELLAGTPPYVDEDGAVDLEMLGQEPPASLELLAPNVPIPLAVICEKAMAMKVEDRYSSAEEFARDLGEFLSDGSRSALPNVRQGYMLLLGAATLPIIAIATGVVSLEDPFFVIAALSGLSTLGFVNWLGTVDRLHVCVREASFGQYPMSPWRALFLSLPPISIVGFPFWSARFVRYLNRFGGASFRPWVPGALFLAGCALIPIVGGIVGLIPIAVIESSGLPDPGKEQLQSVIGGAVISCPLFAAWLFIVGRLSRQLAQVRLSSF